MAYRRVLTMRSRMKGCTAIRNEWALGISVSINHGRLQTEYGEEVLSCQIVGHWCCMLSQRRYNVKKEVNIFNMISFLKHTYIRFGSRGSRYLHHGVRQANGYLSGCHQNHSGNSLLLLRSVEAPGGWSRKEEDSADDTDSHRHRG
ncbi:hypothetical protein TNCV_1836541 [Trichonephila clavipes]|nr:hypothetical protein TNCV_1836541 [Trichonephila clavipes]